MSVNDYAAVNFLVEFIVQTQLFTNSKQQNTET